MTAVIFSCSKSAWSKAAKQAKAAAPRGRAAEHAPAAIRTEDTTVFLCVEGAEMGCTASVAEHGNAVMPYPILRNVINYVAAVKERELTFCVEDGRIELPGGGKLTHDGIRVSSEAPSPSLIELPMEATLLEILALGRRYTEEQIAASGYEARLADAHAQATSLISRAAKILEPLGIEVDDLERFALEKIRMSEEGA